MDGRQRHPGVVTESGVQAGSPPLPLVTSATDCVENEFGPTTSDHGRVTGNAERLPMQRLEEAVRRIGTNTSDRLRTGSSHENADETLGSYETDSAIGFDPFPVLEALHRHGATVVVIGQVAGIMHGSTELTGDLDLLWDGRQRQAGRIAAAFTAAGATLTDDAGARLSCTAEAFELPKVLFRTRTASGDCCTPKLPWGDLDIEGILRRPDIAVGPAGVVIRYARRADLIVMRRTADRAKDHRRADELERLALDRA